MLKDRELTDLVNYVLGLPLRKNGRGVILRPPISICVIQSLNKHRWPRIEKWAELMLRKEGVLPKRKSLAGSGRSGSCPPEIQRFVVYGFGPRKQPGKVVRQEKAISA